MYFIASAKNGNILGSTTTAAIGKYGLHIVPRFLSASSLWIPAQILYQSQPFELAPNIIQQNTNNNANVNEGGGVWHWTSTAIAREYSIKNKS